MKIIIDSDLKLRSYNIKDKKFSISSIINKEEQKKLMNSIKDIDLRKGNLNDSDICFLKKK